MLLVWLSACQEKKTAPPETSAPVAIAPPTDTVAVIDTVFETQLRYTEEYEHHQDQYEFRAGEDVYKAFTESYSLNDSSLVQIWPDSAGGRLVGYKGLRCHNHVYKIRLTKNGKLLYQKQFSKPDFLKLEDTDYIKESVPFAPTFRGVTADGRVIFDMWFGFPESDAGEISFFTTDLKGTLLQLEAYSGTGGAGCERGVEVTPNGQYFLSCQKLYGPKRYEFNFGKEEMVTARFLSDTSFVALYNYVRRYYDPQKREWQEEYDDKTPNLIIYHVSGKKLASHFYHGFFNILDYQAPIDVLKEQGVLLLLDEAKKEVQTISMTHPQSAATTKLSSLTKLLNGKRQAAWHESPEFYAMEGKYRFYFAADTLKAYAVTDLGQ